MKKGFEFSKRLQSLPPYLFAEIDRTKYEMRKKGIDFIDLSIGDPDIGAPKTVLDIMYKASKLKVNQKYALDQGKDVFRMEIKHWFKNRFKVDLNDSTEILPVIGTKEGIVHFPMAYVNPGDYVIIPSPGYPGYRGAAIFAGAKVYEMPLLEENNFLPDLDKIPANIREKAKIMFLGYPNNPTTVLAPKAFLEKLVKFCSKYGIIIAYDNAYSEIYFDKKPLSILEIKGAKEMAIEYHSLSKTFCMTGFRIGWACGNPELVKGLAKVKTNFDSGIFGAIQDAGAYALKHEGKYVDQLRATIKDRRDYFINALAEKGFNEVYSDSTFYLWVKTPKKYKKSTDLIKELLAKGIVATPGSGFGKHGEGYIRFALTVDKTKLKQATKKL